jgi:hypothetical protein
MFYVYQKASVIMLIPIRSIIKPTMRERMSHMFSHAAAINDKLRPAQALRTHRRLILDNRNCRRLAGFPADGMWE